jgi:microcin C transport system permease protein
MTKDWWAKFKSDHRAYRALILLLIIFSISLLSELIANDKPLLVFYKKQFYWPVFKAYSEKTFQGDFATEADYRDPQVQNLIKQNGWMIFPFIPYSYDTICFENNAQAPSRPSWNNLLGTDDNGRDVLARLIYGLRISLLFGLILTFCSAVLGISLGALQGYFGGILDLFLQRLIEIWSGLPILFLLIILSSIIEPGFWILLLIMLLFSWMSLVGMVRAEFLKIRNYDFVKAARVMGASHFRIIFHHILPNALSSAFATLPFFRTGNAH